MIPRPRAGNAPENPASAVHRPARPLARSTSPEPSVRDRLTLARELWLARRPSPRQHQPRQPRWRRQPEKAATPRGRSRPVLAGCLKALVLFIPAAVAVLSTALLNWGMEAPESLRLRVG